MQRFLPLLVPVLMLVPPALVLLCTHWKQHRPEPLVTCTYVLLILQAILSLILFSHLAEHEAYLGMGTVPVGFVLLLFLAFDWWVVFAGRRASTQSLTAFAMVVIMATVVIMTVVTLDKMYSRKVAETWIASVTFFTIASLLIAFPIVTWVKTPTWTPWLVYTAVAAHMMLLLPFIGILIRVVANIQPDAIHCDLFARTTTSLVCSLVILSCDLVIVSRPSILFRLPSTHVIVRAGVSTLAVVLPITSVALFRSWWYGDRLF